MESSVLSFLRAEWKVSDTGLAQCWASSYLCFNIFMLKQIYEAINRRHFELNNKKQELPMTAMFVNGSKRNEYFP
jgi:hypothetical protein